MYWKYHIEKDDLVQFVHDGRTVAGTVLGWIDPDQFEGLTLEDVEPSDFELRIKSGKKEVNVNLTDVTSRVDKDERETDLPYMSEEFRLTGGI